MNRHRCPSFPQKRIRNLGLTLIAVVFFFGGCLQAQVTIRVPADQPTIQGGINAANNGDTVLVSPGTYTEALHFNGKAITVTSGATSYSDPITVSTIIRQPQYGKPVVFYAGLETPSTVLNGFTIIGLAQDPGTGSGNGTFYSPIIWGPDSRPTITNSDISSGVAGVHLLGGFISSNRFSGFIDAAVQTDAATVADNLFENTSPDQAALSADGNTIVERNIFRNTGYSAAQLADGVVFVNNLVYGSQGPVLYSASSGSSIKTIIAENTFNNLSLPNGAPRCLNNLACTAGSQISVTIGGASFGSALLIANNIFYSNDAVAMIGCTPNNSTVPANSDTLLLDHNLFYSTAGAPMLSGFCRAQIAPAGNVSTDPQLANPSTGDFHLLAGSPAIDAGNNSIFTQTAALGFSLDSDLDRNPRPQDGTGRGYSIVDIGAYEVAGVANGQATGVLLTPSAYDLRLGLSLTLYVTVTSPLGVPFGTVSFFDNGVLAGSATLSSLGTATFQPANLTIGVNEFEADYAGSAPFPPGVSLKTIVRVELVPTHLALTAAPNPARPGAQVVLTVTASADDGSVPSPVALTDNGNALATLLPNSAGVATFSVGNLAIGAHTIVATYAGDGRHPPASATLTLNIVSHDFTLTVDPAALTLRTEYHSAVTLHLAPVGDFAENVTIACLDLPTNATCTLGQTSLALRLPTDIHDVIDTDFVLRFRSSLDGPGSHPSPDRSHPLTFLAWIPILLFGRRLRRSAFAGRDGRSALPNLMLLTLLLGGLTALTACSGKYPGSTPPGTYTIMIQAVSTSGITHSAPLTLTVTP